MHLTHFSNGAYKKPVPRSLADYDAQDPMSISRCQNSKYARMQCNHAASLICHSAVGTYINLAATPTLDEL